MLLSCISKRLTCFALFSLILSAAFASPALSDVGPIGTRVGDPQWLCETPKPGEDYVNLVFDPTEFGIHASEDDAGWEFEMEFWVWMSVRAYDDNKPDWTGPEICSFEKRWSRVLPIFNIRSGYDGYPAPERFNLDGIPRKSVVTVTYGAKEVDDFLDDWADFSKFNDGNSAAIIEVFANAWKARTMVGEAEGRFDVGFGVAKRLEGDGNITWLDRDKSFPAALEFVLDLYKAERGIGGIGAGQPVPTSPPGPEGDPVCRDYALRSVEQNREQQALGCGFVPPQWSNDHQAHFDWCQHGNNAAQVQSILSNRDAQIASCKQAAVQPPPPPTPAPAPADPAVAICQAYASEAVAIAAKAALLNCPEIVGPRWLQDFNAHYNWCIANPNPVVMLAEAAARDATYRACGGQ